MISIADDAYPSVKGSLKDEGSQIGKDCLTTDGSQPPTNYYSRKKAKIFFFSKLKVASDNQTEKSPFFLKLLEDYLVLNSPVQGDGDEGEDADVDAEELHGGTELAHELWKIPPLEQSRVEL